MIENLSNKTCGECKHFYDYKNRRAPCVWSTPSDCACYDFELKVITNGDKIRQMSNEDLAERFGIHAMCDFCLAETADCQHGQANIKYCKINWLNWLNAPAESEGEDE